MAIRVMMIDSNVNHINEVKQYFGSPRSNIELSTLNNIENVEEIINKQYDVLIVDMLVINQNLNELLIKRDKNKILILSSDYITTNMIGFYDEFGPDYIIKFPIQMEILEKLILKEKDYKTEKQNDIQEEITNVLHSLGMPSHIKGFQYVRDGIEMIYKDKKLIGNITKEVYPRIALSNESTSSRVERAIRHAIEVAWIRAGLDEMDDMFGNSIDFERSKPTNSEFMVTIADRLHLQNEKILDY